jgi:hypothetical protein
MKRILAADCGNTTTTAALIEHTGGEYHLKATGQTPSTYAAPWEDITIGVQEAIRHIEKVVGYTILTSGGWPITPKNPGGQGVDVFVVVSSAGYPLQVLIAGLMQDISLASAKRALAATYAHVTNVISLDAQDEDDGSSGRQGLESRIQAIQEGSPEVVLLVGGTDGGAERPIIDMAQSISMAFQIWQTDEKPSVLYAGNSHLRPQLADILGPVTELKSINNIRPMLDVEDLSAAQTEMESLYLERKMLQLPGFDKLNNWSKYPVIPAGKSFEKLISYLGKQNNLNVIGANIGSRSTVVSAQAQESLSLAISSDAGVGHSLASLLNYVPIEQFHRWLPFGLSPEELYNILLNKSLHPTTIPSTYQDLIIEHAVAREALRFTANQTQGLPPDTQWNLIVGAGKTLTGTPQAAQAALILVDAFEPWGVTSLVLDKYSIVNMLGLIAAAEPTAAAQIVAKDTFLNLGTVIAPAGHRSAGKPVMKIKLDLPGGETIEKEFLYGTVDAIPLAPGQKATLEIHPARHFDIGLGQPGRGAVAEVEGGALGIIIDARGRPLRLPKDGIQRQEQLQQWLTSLNINYATTNNNY